MNIRDNFFSPVTTTAQAGDTVTWGNAGNNQHTTTSNTLFWDSGTLDSAQNSSPTFPTSFSFTFPATGNFGYFCNIHGFTGLIVVPLTLAPASGTTTTTFTITWAAAPLPAGFVEDIQIKRPGATVFKNWKVGQTGASATFTPDKGIGGYKFHARLRQLSNGLASSYTAKQKIIVS